MLTRFFTLFPLILLLTAGISLAISWYAWRRTTNRRKVFSLMMLAVAEWALAGAFEAAAVTQRGKIFWSQASYLGIHSIPLLFLTLAWVYTQREDLLRPAIMLPLAAIPALTVSLALTNGQHQLIWSGYHWAAERSSILVYEYSPAFWVGTLYAYLLVLAATITFLVAARQSAGLYRKQTQLIILAALVPWAGNILYVTKINFFTQQDFSPIFFLISGILLALSLFKYQFLQLTPFARQKVLNTMSEAVVVIDRQNKISDLNTAARHLLSDRDGQLLGCPAAQALGCWPDLVSLFSQLEKIKPSSFTIQNKGDSWYEGSLSPLQGWEQKVHGWVLILKDITEKIQLKAERQAREKLYRSVTENANDSLVIIQDYIIQYCNPQLGTLLGLDSEEIIGQWFLERTPPALRTTIETHHQRRMQGEEVPSRYETTLIHTSGRHIPVEFNISTITYQGKPATLGVIRDITTQKKSEQKLNRFAHQQQLLNEIIQESMQADELEEALQILADRLGDLIQADGCFFSLWDEELEMMQHAAVNTRFQKIFQNFRLSTEHNPLVAAVLNKNEMIVVDENKQFPVHLTELPHPLPFPAFLIIPLIVDDHKLGVALLSFERTHTFTPEELDLAEQASRQIGLILIKLKLTEEAERRALEMQTLGESGLAVSSTLDLGEATERILKELQRVVPYDSASIQLLQKSSMVIIGGGGWEHSEDMLGLRFPIPGKNPNTRVVKERQPVIIADTQNIGQDYPAFQQPNNQHIRSWLGVPLISQDEVIGMLALDSLEANHFSPNHLSLVRTFANHVTVAMENIRLYQESQALAQESRALYQISLSTTVIEDLSELLQDIANSTAGALSTDQVMIILVDQNKKEVVHFAKGGKGADLIEMIPFQELWEGLSGWVLRNKKPALSSHGTPDSRESQKVQKKRLTAGAGDVIVAPLVFRDQVLGTITVSNRLGQRRFTERDVELLMTVAQHTTVAIENASLFEEVQRLAITDDLTEVHNRRYIFTRGAQEFTRSRRYHHPLTVIMLDIDKFKPINDQFGHAAGDKVLHILAQGFRSLMREYDEFGRSGGEEFLMILPESNLEEGIQAAERLRRYAEEASLPVELKGHQVTISLGVAERTEEIRSFHHLVERADQAMYLAKERGRNQAACWTEDGNNKTGVPC